MATSKPALEAVRYGLIDDAVVVVGTLTTCPSVSWRRAFRRIVDLAGFGVHPHLIDDVVIAIAEANEAPRAHFAIRTAIDMTGEAVVSSGPIETTVIDQTSQSTHTERSTAIR